MFGGNRVSPTSTPKASERKGGAKRDVIQANRPTRGRARALLPSQERKCCDLSGFCFGQKTSVLMLSSTPKIQDMQSLVLRGCGLDSQKITELAPVIGRLLKLEELALSGNEIEDGGALALAKVLANLKRLQVLDLKGNPISPKGRKAVAKLLGERITVYF